MSSTAPKMGDKAQKQLRKLGFQIKAQRKGLGISAAATAESSGISRVTLHRIEKGEKSVSMAAYMNVIIALGLNLELSPLSQKKRSLLEKKLPRKIPLNQYPQLRRLAWQLKETQSVSPKEALEIYERNWRHIDIESIDSEERELIKQLLDAFGRERFLV